MGEAIRVLIVDDMQLIHKMLKTMLETDPEIQVVGMAKNGKEGIELTEKLKPDVIIMDIHMPVMDGFEATRHLMQYLPTPILIMSSSTIITERNATFEALKAGALDVMEKPDGRFSSNLKEIGAPIIQKLKRFSRVKVIRRIASIKQEPPIIKEFKPASTKNYRILAIGSSTGGPSALVDLLDGFPKDFAIPIAIVQHISSTFAESFAEWLGNNIPLSVKIVQDKEILTLGKVYIAGKPSHLSLDNNLQAHLLADTASSYHVPSVDILFSSLAQNIGDKSIGVILTGMGEDGAKGLYEISQKGGKTYAQDQESSLVYGMPKKAVDLGAASYSGNPKEIAKMILQLMGY